MAHVQWCVGNTTLREAARLKDGLRILKEHFNGKPWSYENQKKFLSLLAKGGVYEPGQAKSDKQIEQHGRIWSSAFNELGFATCYKTGNSYVPSGVQITKVGHVLLSDDYVEDDIWLRQLLKVQFPNPLPQKSKNQYPQFHLLPFQATLRVIDECDGISKDEGFIINTIKSISEVNKAIVAIKTYRKGLDDCKVKGKDVIRRFIIQQQCNQVKILYKEEIKNRLEYLMRFKNSKSRTLDFHLLNEIIKGGKGSKTEGAINLSSDLKQLRKDGANLEALNERFLLYYLALKSGAWRDYIDATTRYFRMSGLLTVHRSRITISEDHKDVVKWILKQEWELKSNDDYLKYLHDCTLPILPQDNIVFLKKKTEQTLKAVASLIKTTDIKIEPKIIEVDEKANDPLILRKQLLKLTEKKRELKEYEYMMLLNREAGAIDEIIDYFDSIMNNEILGYRPTHFEWNVWRGFLAIDKLSRFPHECRNFTIDDDLQPRSNAPGGKADMVFYYDDHILVVEVTLSTGETQYNTEHEPVPRHVVRIMEQEKGKDVYSIFIAPQIHINTAIHFYAKMTSVPHVNTSGDEVYPRIIPFSLDTYKKLLKIFQSKRFSPSQLKTLLCDIVDLKNNPTVTNGSHWVRLIEERVEKWAAQL